MKPLRRLTSYTLLHVVLSLLTVAPLALACVIVKAVLVPSIAPWVQVLVSVASLVMFAVLTPKTLEILVNVVIEPDAREQRRGEPSQARVAVDCERYRQHAFAISASLRRGTMSDHEIRRVEAEFARVFHLSSEAIGLIKRVGFPRAGIPRFDTPLNFWCLVFEKASQGIMHGGARAIVEEAAKQYPANRVFARYQGWTWLSAGA